MVSNRDRPVKSDALRGIIAAPMYYPVNVKVGGERCLVVGGGAVAWRKARALLQAGARLLVVSPVFDPRLVRMKIERARRPFAARDVEGMRLVISATDDARVNRAVHRACARRAIPVNVVDQPDLCTFIVPSIIRRGPVTLAISTGGASPALSKALRKQLEALYPGTFGKLAMKIGAARKRIMQLLPSSPARTRILKSLAARR